MRAKNIYFVLMTVSIILAASCTKEKLLHDITSRPGSPFLNPPSLVPNETNPQYHIYSDIEENQLRQHLRGRYSGMLNNRAATLWIGFDHVEVTETRDYHVTLPTNSEFFISFSGPEPILIFSIHGIPETFRILLKPNSYTRVIGICSMDKGAFSLRKEEVDDDTDTTDLSDEENNQHDEL